MVKYEFKSGEQGFHCNSTGLDVGNAQPWDLGTPGML